LSLLYGSTFGALVRGDDECFGRVIRPVAEEAQGEDCSCTIQYGGYYPHMAI